MNPSLTITGIQTDIVWENKEANLKLLQEKIHSVPAVTDIVILPEMFSTGFTMRTRELAESMEGQTIKWMKEIASTKKVILTGSAIIAESKAFADAVYYNRLIWMLPTGQFGYYDKRHLFAYGDEDRHYTAGSKRLIASVNGWKIHLLVCYDLRFPVWARQNPSKDGVDAFEYDLLVYVANWPEKRIEAWKTLLRARAIENQCFVAGINRVGDDGKGIHYTGESMVVDPAGEVLHCKKDVEDIFTVTLEKSTLDHVREKFPFWKDADEFEIN